VDAFSKRGLAKNRSIRASAGRQDGAVFAWIRAAGKTPCIFSPYLTIPAVYSSPADSSLA
jgi:hypothetical protein